MLATVAEPSPPFRPLLSTSAMFPPCKAKYNGHPRHVARVGAEVGMRGGFLAVLTNLMEGGVSTARQCAASDSPFSALVGNLD